MFQKRLDGSVDFYLGWAQYQRGFGNLTGEFWLGLDKIHRLTSSESYKLRVDLEDFAGNTYYAEYDSFNVASEGEKYKLSVGSYAGWSIFADQRSLPLLKFAISQSRRHVYCLHFLRYQVTDVRDIAGMVISNRSFLVCFGGIMGILARMRPAKNKKKNNILRAGS